MSDALGTRVYGGSQQQGAYGANNSPQMSDKTADLIDKEVTRILDEQYERAKTILEENRDKVEVMTHSLMEYETLDADQISEIMDGKKPTPPSDLPAPKRKDRDDNEGRPDIKPQLDQPAGEAE